MITTGEPQHSLKSGAKYLGVSVQGLRDKALSGEIRYWRFGRMIRIPQSAIDEYIQRNTFSKPATDVVC